MNVPEMQRTGTESVAAQVRRAIAETLEIPVADVRGDADLEADLGIDSLGMIQISVTLDEALGVRAPDMAAADALAIETVDDLIALVAAQVGGR